MGVLSRSELVFVLTVLAVLLILLIFFVIPRAGGGAFVVAFSDRGDINGDGKGEYIDGLDNLRIGDRGNLFMAQLSGETSRYVYIRFEDMSWRDEDLKPVDPQLPSSQYQLVLMIYLHGATLRTMDVGLSYEPSIWIVAVDTGQNASYGLLRSPVELSDVRFFTLNSTPATPPPSCTTSDMRTSPGWRKTGGSSKRMPGSCC